MNSCPPTMPKNAKGRDWWRAKKREQARRVPRRALSVERWTLTPEKTSNVQRSTSNFQRLASWPRWGISKSWKLAIRLGGGERTRQYSERGLSLAVSQKH